MWDYLRIEVPDDTHGVLQDVHWLEWLARLLPDVCARQPDLGAALDKVSLDLPDLGDEFERERIRRAP